MSPEEKGVLIPNIDFGRTFDLRYQDAEIHYESLGSLAAFFGRNMPIHRHDRVLQIHFLEVGEVRLHLDQAFYHQQAPLVFVTPPAIPHAFVIDPASEGHVLTINQSHVWALCGSDPSNALEAALTRPCCFGLRPAQDPLAQQLFTLIAMIRQEFAGSIVAREVALAALARSFLITLGRLAARPAAQRSHPPARASDVTLFRAFNLLVEAHFAEHWSLTQYSSRLNVTEGRLNDICRRICALSSKRVVNDRIWQEARRMLMFSRAPVTEIAYRLGFKDPAYFCRAFRRDVGMAPAGWRERHRAIVREPVQDAPAVEPELATVS